MGTLRVIDIIEGTAVDGPGLRTSIYFAGCTHRCPGCHNQHTWPFDAGRDMTVGELIGIVNEAGMNVTFSGGDPLLQPDLDALALLARLIRQSGRTLWCYTGFEYEQLLHMPQLSDVLSQVNVLVDGPFREQLRDISLLFRGSSNQRLINLDATRSSGDIVLWQQP